MNKFILSLLFAMAAYISVSNTSPTDPDVKWVIGNNAKEADELKQLRAKCTSDFVEIGVFNGKRYYTTPGQTTLNWEQAFTFCKDACPGSKPLKIGSVTEAAYLNAIIENQYVYWTSGREVDTSNRFSWESHSSSSLKYNNFCTSLPDRLCIAFSQGPCLRAQSCEKRCKPLCQLKV